MTMMMIDMGVVPLYWDQGAEEPRSGGAEEQRIGGSQRRLRGSNNLSRKLLGRPQSMIMMVANRNDDDGICGLLQT